MEMIRKHFLTICGVIAVVTISLNAFFYIHSVRSSQQTISRYSYSESKVSLLTPEQLTHWDTYTNSDFGIEFKYPNDLFDNLDTYPVNGQTQCEKNEYDVYPSLAVFSASFDDGIDANSMDIQMLCTVLTKDAISSEAYPSKVTKTKIGIYRAYEYTILGDNAEQGIGGRWANRVFVVPFKTYSLKISFYSGFGYSNRPKILEGRLVDQMLSTFNITPRTRTLPGTTTTPLPN